MSGDSLASGVSAIWAAAMGKFLGLQRAERGSGQKSNATLHAPQARCFA
jgi:hypothetical protein